MNRGIALAAILHCGCVEIVDENEVSSAESEAPAPRCAGAGSFAYGPTLTGPYAGWADVPPIPADCKNIDLKIWGDGGGPGGGDPLTGGGGGFAHLLLDNTTQYHRFKVKVGGTGNSVYSGSLYYGGMGTFVNWIDDQGSWGPLVAVAGGGGGGGRSNSDRGRGGGAEQAGQSASGTFGIPPTNRWCTVGGGGGAGPGAGTGGNAVGNTTALVPGHDGVGPATAPTQNGGGGGALESSGQAGNGGAGYYGGGGGGYCHLDWSARIGGGGGGGGNFAGGGGAHVMFAETQPGNFEVPGNAGDPDRCENKTCVAGQGATAEAPQRGFAGRIVVRWW